MNNLFQQKPIRIILQGNKELAAEYSGEAKQVLFKLRNIQKTSPFTQELEKRYEDGTTINVHSKVKGMDVVYITSPFSDKKYSEWELKEEISSESLVVIIPCTSNESYENTIDGMVCVDITEEGFGKVCDWTNEVSYESKDPGAPYTEQETFRKEWYDKKTTVKKEDEFTKIEEEYEIVRCQRVDGGYLSYDGNPWEYEYGGLFATEIDAGNDYDAMEYNYQEEVESSLSVEPGPVPFAPYNDWSWFGDGTTYYGEEQLFLTIWNGGVPPAGGSCGYWWPEEFNQKISFDYTANQFMYSAVGTDNWDYDTNLPQSHIFSYYKRNRHLFRDYRSWINFPAEDGTTAGNYEYVYNTEDTVTNSYPFLINSSIISFIEDNGECIDVVPGGIYIYHMLDNFLSFAYRYPDFFSTSERTRVEKRLPASADRLEGELTDRQITLLEGNSEVEYDPPFSTTIGTFETVYKSERNIGYSPYYDVGMFCEGVFYKIADSELYYSIYTANGLINEGYGYNDNFYMWDYGIFTTDSYNKPGDKIDTKKLIYVYAIENKQVIDGHNTTIAIQYGVIFKGDTSDRIHIMSDWYEVYRPVWWYAYSIFPNFNGKDKDGKQLYGHPLITIGTKKTKTKKYTRYEIK